MAIVELMLSINDNSRIFYHKDTNTFDEMPISEIQLKKLKEKIDKNMEINERIPYKDDNNFSLPTYEEIDHKEIMRFYVDEFVDDKTSRKELFYVLRRHEYVDAYLEKLRELALYDDFIDACGDIYIQIFSDWAEKNGLVFR